MTEEYDLIVIGAGPVGENVADRAVQAGLTALIVERELVGGECSYWACMPSKALLRPIQALRSAERVSGASQAIAGQLDVAAVLARRDSFASEWSDASQVDWLDSAGIDLARGHARLSGEREVTISDSDGDGIRTVRARHAVVIATGSDAVIPDTPGLREAKPWTSREATSAAAIPTSLAVIGGGVVAVEMATAHAALGAQVTMIVRGRVLSNMEPFVGDRVLTSLRAQGITVHIGASVETVERLDAGVVITTTSGSEIRADEVLVATGRAPRTTDVGLETVGLTPGEWIQTDDTLRVPGIDWLYAAGDVNHRALLTHQGKYQARAAGDVIAARALGDDLDTDPWGRHVATADHTAVPQVVFGDPEVASVGLTERAARVAKLPVSVVDYDLGAVAGASVHADGYAGQARLVIDRERQVVVGATFVGPDVAELLQAATFAIVGEIPLKRLWHAVPAYPTINEIWLRLLEKAGRATA